MIEVVNIPEDRKAVLIGHMSKTKVSIEKLLGVKLNIDESVTIDGEPVSVLRAKNIVVAIGCGFSPERASRLLNDDAALETINIKEPSKSDKFIGTKRSRLIGRRGLTRKLIETYTGAFMSVYGHTVALIGNWKELRIAKTAVGMLLEGKPHSVVYRYIEQEGEKTKKMQQ